MKDAARGLRAPVVVVVVVLFALAGIVAGCGTSGGGETSPPSSPAAEKPPSKAEVEKFVDEAYDYAQAQGKEKALAEFSKKDGAFYRGQLYLFAYDMDGTLICSPVEPALVGTNRWDYRDATGKYVVRELVDVARDPGSGWVDYEYANPTQEGAVQAKTSYVRGIDGTWLIAAGTFRPQE